ncbi:hemerythrin HHE cation binding domain-containing protein [Hydrogenivirga caldilitoris]|uniref:Hemerythrin HHE cation binding domain-containing protein n=1 Tax=Hydrogenivirga caldilitoris TaxID=246264 RepID=A0A497XRB7_9AQUI|nr:hemerythrin domain-containing protein [Hydrogenivirga caldilitoris]RLJ70831.1 hemerythrin HHE cation binding domain-containing protein [Hydrogenivirga caldilitoris]
MMIAQYMTEEHRKCDSYYAEAEKAVTEGNWEKAKEAFREFKEKTLLHFQKEEEVLFPEFEERTGIVMGPTQVMRHEHAQARELLERLEKALETQNKDEFLSIGESLMILIQQHNMKEEQILYPMSDQHLESEEMVEKMAELGEV